MQKWKPLTVDLILYGSAHQDQMPTASVRIQEELGIEQCGEISIHANCTSAYKAILLGHDLLKNGRYQKCISDLIQYVIIRIDLPNIIINH